MKQTLTLQTLNTLDAESFVAAVGGMFEDSPWIAAQAWALRPFESLSHLHQAMCAVLYNAGQEAQLALIQAHPDLAGRAAQQGMVSAASTNEQAAAGLDQLTPDELDEFTRLNQAYREKFDFPFVICVRENRKASILAGFRARLPNTREQEIATALTEIGKIAWLRLSDVVQEV